MCKVWILEFGDFGFWILGILDFGFWGFWILDFGDLGFLDFGLGILDGHLVTKFWMLHKKRRLCTPNRVGGFLCFFGCSISKADISQLSFLFFRRIGGCESRARGLGPLDATCIAFVHPPLKSKILKPMLFRVHTVRNA